MFPPASRDLVAYAFKVNAENKVNEFEASTCTMGLGIKDIETQMTRLTKM